MDTPAAREADLPPASGRGSQLPGSLAAELRTSVFLLGGALGTMTLIAFTLLLVTHWLAR
jgi:hypothetical protein